MRVFLLLFLLFPVLELFVLVRVGMSIGFLWTFLLVLSTSVLGLFVMRVAGLATALRARESLSRGELPAQQMLEGLTVAVGGGLLLLPGFISDILGVICLLPFTRRMLAGKLRQRAEAQATRQRAFSEDLHQASQGPASSRPGAIHQPTREPDVIEGEFEHRDK
ncbi:membrane protein FxsA [Pseudomonas cichorii]|uniref:FxsA family protein n=1 Tax=Pseudomonas cichorii TaxID=36746 RepID=UPI001910D08F|nr:FxsA family protein [Pseudomonas cichorii]GFM84438.1 membrane protein FxsA [Pseudomonas cichorii]